MLAEFQPCFAAVDASMIHSKLAVVLWGQDLSASVPEEFDAIHSCRAIGIAELMAIAWAVHIIVAKFPACNVLIIATDSMTAKSWVDNRVAANAAANALLRDLFATLTRERRISLSYVSTASNAADPKSRGNSCLFGNDDGATRRRDTQTVLRLATKSALALVDPGRRLRMSDELNGNVEQPVKS